MVCPRLEATWRRTLRALRQECAPLLPVRVRREPGPSHQYGYTTLARDEDHFNIVVFERVYEGGRARRCRPLELRDTLVHEWAHACAWPGTDDQHTLEFHDASWGVAYARCYQAVIED